MILDDIHAYLIAQGLVPANNYPLSTSVFPTTLGYIPDDQDEWIALFETKGGPALTMQREVQARSFQLRVRGSRLNYLPTYKQWQACFNALQDSQPTPAYALVQAVDYGPLFFNDDRGRSNFISNFRVILTSAQANS